MSSGRAHHLKEDPVGHLLTWLRYAPLAYVILSLSALILTSCDPGDAGHPCDLYNETDAFYPGNSYLCGPRGEVYSCERPEGQQELPDPCRCVRNGDRTQFIGCFEVCGSGFDDDGNGLSDCQDPACAEQPACIPIPFCTLEDACDDQDNDCDDNIDETYEQNEITCDEIDNNCDELIDEKPWAMIGEDSPECNVPLEMGICVPGSWTCIPHLSVACEPVVRARDEQCNALDDDCDGQVDEDIAQEICGIDPPLRACGGEIHQGTLLCEGGILVCRAQAQMPEAEVLNDLDDDCDGLIDEGLRCIPAQESCNTLDDDCDGATDEDFRDSLGSSCSVESGQPECRYIGLFGCYDGGLACLPLSEEGVCEE